MNQIAKLCPFCPIIPGVQPGIITGSGMCEVCAEECGPAIVVVPVLISAPPRHLATR